MKKVVLLLFKSVLASSRLIYFISALILFLLLSYFLGFDYLQALRGNDTYYHLTNLYWLNRYLPNIYLWFPLQNGGVIPLWGYPFFSYALVILISKFSTLTLPAAFQLLGFLSVPLTALGIYLFVWLRLKNQTIALIAGVFYILMPMTWVWLFDWGFFTESISYIFIFPSIIFYDIFLNSVINKKVTIWSRLSFVGGIFLLSFLFLTHPASFFIALTIALFLTLFQTINFRKKITFESIGIIILPLTAFAVLTLLLSSFFLIDFYAYSKKTAPSAPGASVKNEFLEGYATPVYSFLGLGKIPQTEFKYVHRNIVIPPAVWIAAVAGLISSLLLSRKVFGLSLLAFLPILVFQWPIIAWYMMKIPFASYVLPHRYVLILARMLIPLIGAFGVWGVWKLITEALTFWIKKEKVLFVKKIFISISTSLFALVTAGCLIFYFGNWPESLWHNTEFRYGPYSFDIREPFKNLKNNEICELSKNDIARPKACDIKTAKRNINLTKFISTCNSIKSKPLVCTEIINGTASDEKVKSFIDTCADNKLGLCESISRTDFNSVANYLSNFKNWPKPNLTKNLQQPLSRFSPFIQAHKYDPFLRIDISPYLGGAVQSLNLESDISQINLYAITLSLLEPYWGYQQQVMFSENTGNTLNVNNLAKYFGIQYLFLEDKLDPIEKYENDPVYWQKVDKAGIWKFKNSTKLWSWTVDKPSVLVIGNDKLRAYEPFFRIAMNGGIQYDDAWIVNGKANIDDYTLSELKHFDTLVLFGYSYSNSSKAFSLLNDFVKQGGNLYISGGWQYVDQDWNLQQTPDVFPVNGLKWQNASGNFLIEDPEVVSDIDLDKFSPLSWNGGGWGVSVPGTLKDWAKPVLSVDGQPIVVAGEFGNGKVIWSGFNIFGHISTYEYNQEEISFINKLFSWFHKDINAKSEEHSENLSLIRSNPEKLEFTFNKSTQNRSVLYWRESVYQNWQATLINPNGSRKKLEIYKGGPGFMLMNLDPIERGSKLELVFKTNLRTYLGRLISIFTLIVLIVYIIWGYLIFSKVFRSVKPLKNKVKNIFSKLHTNISKEEESY